eukprot:gene6414-2461_t
MPPSQPALYTGAEPPPMPYIPWTHDAVSTYWTLWGDGGARGFFVPRACAAAERAAPWRCMFGATSYPHIKARMFIAEAQTDSIVMPLHDGLPKVWQESDPSNGPRCVNDASN